MAGSAWTVLPGEESYQDLVKRSSQQIWVEVVHPRDPANYSGGMVLS